DKVVDRIAGCPTEQDGFPFRHTGRTCREAADCWTCPGWHIGARISRARRYNVEIRRGDSREQVQIGVVPTAIGRTADKNSAPIVREYHPVLLQRRQDHLILG